MTITSERVEALRDDVRLARTRSGRDDAPVAVRAGVLSALLDAYEDQQTRGIHTCHDHCQRTECVLRRERDALVEGVRKLVAEWRAAADAAERDWRQIEVQYPTSVGPLPCDVAINARRCADDFTALLARVEGENT